MRTAETQNYALNERKLRAKSDMLQFVFTRLWQAYLTFTLII